MTTPDISPARPSGDDLATVLAGLGAFVTAELHPGDAEPSAPWRPLATFIDDPTVLAARVEAVRSALAQRAGGAVVEQRVAASVAHLGIVARVVAVEIALDALGVGSGRLSGGDVWWQDVLGGPVPLSIREPVRIRGTAAGSLPLPGSAAEALTEAVIHQCQVSQHVAWGNVASAANSASRIIGGVRPGLAAAALAAADRYLADPRVEGGQLRAGPEFRRRSCCLIYRVAGSREAVCGDCVL